LFKDSGSAVWHVTDKQFAIQLLREEDHIRMIYLQFQTDNKSVKGVTDSKEAGTDNHGDDVCK